MRKRVSTVEEFPILTVYSPFIATSSNNRSDGYTHIPRLNCSFESFNNPKSKNFRNKKIFQFVGEKVPLASAFTDFYNALPGRSLAVSFLPRRNNEAPNRICDSPGSRIPISISFSAVCAFLFLRPLRLSPRLVSIRAYLVPPWLENGSLLNPFTFL